MVRYAASPPLNAKRRLAKKHGQADFQVFLSLRFTGSTARQMPDSTSFEVDISDKRTPDITRLTCPELS